MKPKRKAEPASPAVSKNPLPKESLLILPDSKPERTGLALVFRVDEPEQAAALHTFRAAFGAAAEIEALDERTYVLHVYPGICGCEEAAA